MPRVLNNLFPDMTACTTFKGAMLRIERASQPFERETGAADSEDRKAFHRINFSVVQRPDGKYIPVAVVTDNSAIFSGYLMNHHIGVTN